LVQSTAEKKTLVIKESGGGDELAANGAPVDSVKLGRENKEAL
jgi:hypothetical protein